MTSAAVCFVEIYTTQSLSAAKTEVLKSCTKSYKFNSKCIQTNACTQMFTAALCLIAQNGKQLINR
jgi:hypothetical protein